VLKETKGRDGYFTVCIGDKTVRKHTLVARQWVGNPDGQVVVGHVNRDPSDDHVENLRLVSLADSKMNRTGFKGCDKYEYVKELPTDAELITDYHGWKFDDLYYDPAEGRDGAFYKRVCIGDEVSFRKLYAVYNKTGEYGHVNVLDADRRNRAISFNIFRLSRAMKDTKEDCAESTIEVE
jgi:hypothetical protein